jgi:predicted DNA-binding protein (MmcQ/YjbR family)
VTARRPADPDGVEAFCLSLPGATIADGPGPARVVAVAGAAFAALGPSGALSLRCSAAVASSLGGRRPGIAAARSEADGCWWLALDRPGALGDPDELLDLLRAAYGLAVAGLPGGPERARVLTALRSPLPTRH